MHSAIRDINLAPEGRARINWVKQYMPLLNTLEEEFKREKPFEGKRITVSVHLEAKTAYLSLVLAAGGAEVAVTGSNPLSTQDAVAAALVEEGLKVYAWHDATQEEYENHLNQALDFAHIIIDDGGDLVQLLHSSRTDLKDGVIGGCEKPPQVYFV